MKNLHRWYWADFMLYLVFIQIISLPRLRALRIPSKFMFGFLAFVSPRVCASKLIMLWVDVWENKYPHISVWVGVMSDPEMYCLKKKELVPFATKWVTDEKYHIKQWRCQAVSKVMKLANTICLILSRFFPISHSALPLTPQEPPSPKDT